MGNDEQWSNNHKSSHFYPVRYIQVSCADSVHQFLELHPIKLLRLLINLLGM